MTMLKFRCLDFFLQLKKKEKFFLITEKVKYKKRYCWVLVQIPGTGISTVSVQM